MSLRGWVRLCAVVSAITVASAGLTGCESVGISGEFDGASIDSNTGVDASVVGDATKDGAPLEDGVSPSDIGADEATPDAVEPDAVVPDAMIPDGEPHDVTPGVCGDGLVEGHEACDDGNLVSGDGCDMNCELETGWYCDETGCGCAAGHFGPECAPCPDCGVYGACSEGLDGDGSCGCEVGYTGEDCGMCDVGYAPVDGGPWTDGGWCMPNDECAETYCSDQGLCVYPDGGPLVCECDEGWEGEDCSTNTDECADETVCGPGVCVDQEPSMLAPKCLMEQMDEEGVLLPGCASSEDCETAVCEQDPFCCDVEWDLICAEKAWTTSECNVPGYMCECPQGWAGMHCEENIDECATDEVVCQNGGECMDTNGAYECICVDGWIGDHCETNVDECAADTNPCQNGGECVDTDGAYECVCADGWQGMTCEENIDECAADTNPCLNGGECVDTAGAYECVCPDGWQGMTCEENIDECSLDPPVCANGSVCTDLEPLEQKLCQGSTCESDSCMAAVQALDDWCGQDGGDGVANWDENCAQCAAGQVTPFADCSDIGPGCEDPAGYACECADGWQGTNCEENIDECSFDPPVCANGSVCTDLAPQEQTLCQGLSCDSDVCVAAVQALDGWCGQESGDGTMNWDSSCALCAAGEVTTFADCTEIGDACKDPAGYACECAAGWQGMNCEENVDECSFDPPICANDAVCTDHTPLDHALCQGPTCESDACTAAVQELDDWCGQEGGNGDPNWDESCAQCAAGGVTSFADCTGIGDACDNPAGYACACAQGWTGVNCDEDIDECASAQSVCWNDGQCVNTDGGFECICSGGFTGPICADDLDECAEGLDDCSDDAACNNTVGGFACECNDGYEGDGVTCEDIDECQPAVEAMESFDAGELPENWTTTDNDLEDDVSWFVSAGEAESGVLRYANSEGTSHGDGIATSGSVHADPIVLPQEAMFHAQVALDLGDDGSSLYDTFEIYIQTCPEEMDWAVCEAQDAAELTEIWNKSAYYDAIAQGLIEAEGDWLEIHVDLTDWSGQQVGMVFAFDTVDDEFNEGSGIWLDELKLTGPSLDSCSELAVCENSAGSYSCTCQAGWEGDGFDCVNINECDSPEVCGPNGTCEDNDGSYVCGCEDGFVVDPELEVGCMDVDECAEFLDDCGAASVCTNEVGGFSCACLEGYFSDDGKDCQNVDECASPELNECDASANCVDEETQPCTNSVGCPLDECVTAVGILDPFCLTNWDGLCASCADGGLGVNGVDCSEIAGSGACTAAPFSCSCDDGFVLDESGTSCSDIDECLDAPCLNGGSCENLEGGYACACTDGWTGQDCESDVDECADAPCQNGGLCQNEAGSYLCDCPVGWTGQDCDEDIDECLEFEPCLNGGACNNTAGDYVCECPAGWTGQNCDEDIDECLTVSCNNGLCENSAGSYACLCDSGWEGAACDQNIDDCVPGVCNVGVCVDQVNGYVCDCPDNAQGENCEVVDLINEDFTSGTEGWSTTGDWAIGPTSYVLCTDGSIDSTDPETDHSPDGSNHVAGTVLGGCVSPYTAYDGFEYLTSPAVDASGYGQVTLEFWRWMGTDYPDFQYQHIQVYDGATWATIWEKPADDQQIVDTEWTLISYDITAYANANLQVRWGNNINKSGVWLTSGWNVDDVLIRAE